MKTTGTRGFTLIELLTVIAIIGILFAIVGVSAPRVLEAARIRDVESDFHQIDNNLATYMADNGSYPPGYGFLTAKLNPNEDYADVPDDELYMLDSYMVLTGMGEERDLFDRFSKSFDANGNGVMDLMEFLPLQPAGPDATRYEVPRAPEGKQNEERPYFYAPVNLKDFGVVNDYYQQAIGNVEPGSEAFFDLMNASFIDMSNGRLQQRLRLPSTVYDAYVLISVGPVMQAGGVPTPDPAGIQGLTEEEFDHLVYNIQALRVYWRATRDANDNGEPDFDWRSRVKGEDGKADSYEYGDLYLLPDGTGGQGPIIHQAGG